MGPMGCGKTTIGKILSAKTGWPFYDADEFHPPENVEKMRAGIPLNDEDRQSWLEKLHSKIQELLQNGETAILACSALKQAYRDILGVNQEDVISVYLKGSYELLRERIEARQHPYMNKNLLRSQLEILEEPAGGLTVDISGSPEDTAESILEALERKK